LLRLKAFPGRTLRIERHGRSYRAIVTIAGKRAVLERLFVQSEEGGVMPSVVYVDLFGRDIVSGERVIERVRKR
jgi:hypothetical protein